jgi:hypothetical protein
MRIFIIANNASYSYPVDNIWMKVGDYQVLPEVQFPVAVQSETLNLRFFILTPDKRFQSSQVVEHSADWEGAETYQVFSGRKPDPQANVMLAGSMATIWYEIVRH